MESNKNRNQSAYNFFESLQKEYIVALIRSKIYPSYKDKKYYKNRVMKGKREKIEQIAQRNNLISIFEDDTLYDEFYNKVVPEWGIPQFNYINDENRDWQYSEDLINYFAVKSEVAVNQDGSLKVGTVISNDYALANNMVQVKLRGESKTIPVSTTKLKRIL